MAPCDPVGSRRPVGHGVPPSLSPAWTKQWHEEVVGHAELTQIGDRSISPFAGHRPSARCMPRSRSSRVPEPVAVEGASRSRACSAGGRIGIQTVRRSPAIWLRSRPDLGAVERLERVDQVRPPALHAGAKIAARAPAWGRRAGCHLTPLGPGGWARGVRTHSGGPGAKALASRTIRA